MQNTIIALFLLAAFAAPIHAALVTFTGTDIANSTDPRPNANAAAANFLAAANGLGPTSLLTFEAATLGSFNNYAVSADVSMTGTDFSSVDQMVVNAPFFPTPDALYGYNTTPAGIQFVQMNGGDLIFSFTSPIQSFGVYISGIQLAVETITFSDSSPQTISIPEPGASTDGGIAFVGFTDAGASISSLTLNGLGDILGVDDLRYGFAPMHESPEPGTMTLLGLGLLVLGAGRYFRSRRPR